MPARRRDEADTMSRNTWKNTERTIAARLGGQRVPVSGRVRGDAPDIAHPLLSLEVKHRKRLPAWLYQAMAQAVACAGPDQIPVAILHEHGRRHAADLCMVALADLKSLLDRAAKLEGERNRTSDGEIRRYSNESRTMHGDGEGRQTV
jgi:hypothetical protein